MEPYIICISDKLREIRHLIKGLNFLVFLDSDSVY